MLAQTTPAISESKLEGDSTDNLQYASLQTFCEWMPTTRLDLWYILGNAAGAGRIDIVRHMCKRWDAVKQIHCEEFYALRCALDNHHVNIAEYMCGLWGVKWAAHQNCAVRAVARYGHLGLVKTLCDKPGVNPAVNDNIVLIHAAETGHLDVLHFLCTHPKVRQSKRYAWALEEGFGRAILYGRLDIVRYLCEYVNPFTPITKFIDAMIAASHHADIVRFLCFTAPTKALVQLRGWRGLERYSSLKREITRALQWPSSVQYAWLCAATAS